MGIIVKGLNVKRNLGRSSEKGNVGVLPQYRDAELLVGDLDIEITQNNISATTTLPIEHISDELRFELNNILKKIESKLNNNSSISGASVGGTSYNNLNSLGNAGQILSTAIKIGSDVEKTGHEIAEEIQKTLNDKWNKTYSETSESEPIKSRGGKEEGITIPELFKIVSELKEKVETLQKLIDEKDSLDIDKLLDHSLNQLVNKMKRF